MAIVYMCMCICMYMCCVYMCMCTCMYMCMHGVCVFMSVPYVYMCVCECACVCTMHCVCMCVCECACVCTVHCVCVCVCVHVSVSVHVFMCVHTVCGQYYCPTWHTLLYPTSQTSPQPHCMNIEALGSEIMKSVLVCLHTKLHMTDCGVMRVHYYRSKGCQTLVFLL